MTFELDNDFDPRVDKWIYKLIVNIQGSNATSKRSVVMKGNQTLIYRFIKNKKWIMEEFDSNLSMIF